MNRYQLRRDLEHAVIGKLDLGKPVIAVALVDLLDMIESLEIRVGDLESDVKKLQREK